jgi:urease accessory protein
MNHGTLPSLLQLASQTLPVGAFSYSQGLEWAVAAGIVGNQSQAEEWIGVVLESGIAAWDATWVAASMRALSAAAYGDLATLNERFLASRETRELRAETVQTGKAMLDLLRDGDALDREALRFLERLDDGDGLAYPIAWAAAAAAHGIAVDAAVIGYLWSWVENQVLAALKCVPLGQRAGQRLLNRLGARLESLASQATARHPDDCRNLLPGHSLASMCHETQYTRLFRS